jgi:hypothetical protein
MTERDDLDLVLDRFLGEGPHEIADHVIEASLLTIETTSQRRAGFGPRRNTPMTPVARLGLAAAAVLAVALVGTLVLPAIRGTVGGPTPSLASTADSPSAPAPSGSRPPALMAPIGYSSTGTIVFTRRDPALGGDATWAINPDGSGEAPLRVGSGWGGTTSVPGTGCCAVLSPDGTQVALGYDEVNPFRGPGTLAASRIVNLNGAHVADPVDQQTNNGLFIPQVCGGCGSIGGINYVPRAWSPDGGIIAVEVGGDPDATRDGINLAPTPAGSSRIWGIQVTGPHRDVPVAFSPDSSQLLFIRRSGTDDSGVLMVVGVTYAHGIPTVDGTALALTKPGQRVFADGYFGPAASWSPDGTRVAFAATDESGSTAAMSIYTVAASGGAVTAIAGPGNYITTAKWSPDGTWIAFDQPGASAFHDELAVHPDGSGLTNLTDDFAPGVCCGRWAPNSTAIVVAGTTGAEDRSDLLIVPVNGDPIFQVTQTPAFYTDFSWGPASR